MLWLFINLMEENIVLLKQFALDLLNKMAIQGDVLTSQNGDYYNVQFDVEDTGIMIGYHGDNLHSLQTLLAQMMVKKTGEWLKISVNVGDYFEKRVEYLEDLAERIVGEVLEFNQSVSFPYLNAKERRVVHMYLQDRSDVKTESIGEDYERRLVVFPA